MNKQPKSKKKYDKVYRKNNCKQVILLFNVNTDDDIINYLKTIENKNSYFKNLIRNDMKK